MLAVHERHLEAQHLHFAWQGRKAATPPPLRVALDQTPRAVLIISSSLGAKLFPVMVGNLVERWPMMLHYLCLAIVCGCVLIFSLATFITAIK